MKMTKNDVINAVVAEMMEEVTEEGAIKLKNILIFKLHNYELKEADNLPSTVVYDNCYAMERFAIDMTAAGLKKSTILNYLTLVRKFFTDTGLNFAYVKGQDITDYLAMRQYKDNISQSYKLTILHYLSAFFSWAYRKHHIDVDVMRDVDSVKVRIKQKDRLTDDEVEICRRVAAGDTRKTALLELMLCTGMRVGEIAGLTIEQISFRDGTINIWGEKSSQFRTGYMTPRLKLALRSYLAGREQGAVFVGLRGHGRMCRTAIQDIAKGVAKEAGCHCKATVHIYRKTFASVMYRKTKNILLVSKLLGHSSAEVTTRYYLVDDLQDMQHEVLRYA